jgi:hypothetical protein
MNIFWGILTIAIGLFLSICGFLKSDFIVYRILVARSRLLWDESDKVHIFYSVIGLLVIVMGILISIGIFKKY